MALPVNGSTHLIPAYYSFYRPRKDERLSWPSWLTCSGWLTHNSGHPSAAGRAQDRESSPARDRRSTTVPRHQLQGVPGAKSAMHHCLVVVHCRTHWQFLAALTFRKNNKISVIIVRTTGWLGSRVVSVLDSNAEGPEFESQSRRCRVTVLGKLFTPIVPLFAKQRNW